MPVTDEFCDPPPITFEWYADPYGGAECCICGEVVAHGVLVDGASDFAEWFCEDCIRAMFRELPLTSGD